jgi:hypothetical protein
MKFRSCLLTTVFALAGAGGLFKAEAGIIRIDITSIESPCFGGRVFGPVGAYEKLRGRAYGEVDPTLAGNALITDILLAPRNSRGMVEYSMDIYLLRPIDPARGNHRLFVEIPNRGGKLFGGLNNSAGGNDPATAEQAGEAFLFQRGFTIAWCGWDISATAGNNNLTITVPVAKNPDGSSIIGPSYEYISFDNDHTFTYRLAYATARRDKAAASLTRREHLGDTPQKVSDSGWEYADDNTIRLLPAGIPFQQSAIYEFSYPARDPLVAGLGLAATRDFVSFLRYSTQDAAGHANPLGGDIRFTFCFAISQPARYINDFQTQGFNIDEKGRRVFDGIENWLGGGSGVGINYRFAQPGRTERNRQNHLYPEGVFPFAYPELTDPFTGRVGGRGVREAAGEFRPKVMEINSANEYWAKAASLLHTDLQGNDLPDPENVRFYLVSGAQHGTGNSKSTGVCQQLQNPTNAEPLLRALFVALNEWVVSGVKPPDSQIPRRSDGTAAFAVVHSGALVGEVRREELGWPAIPGVTYTGVITIRYQYDFGPRFDQGCLSNFPPSVINRPAYHNFVSKVDSDGNEIAGVRLPSVAVPTGTATGWALRRAGFGENDGGESAGQYIPFVQTRAERLAAGDPRLSLEERYGSHDRYVEAVTRTAQRLSAQRLLLDEDVHKYIKAAKESQILLHTEQ